MTRGGKERNTTFLAAPARKDKSPDDPLSVLNRYRRGSERGRPETGQTKKTRNRAEEEGDPMHHKLD